MVGKYQNLNKLKKNIPNRYSHQSKIEFLTWIKNKEKSHFNIIFYF